MKFRIEIDCDGAAFEGDPWGEVYAILHRLQYEAPMHPVAAPSKPLRGSNGDTVGRAEFVREVGR